MSVKQFVCEGRVKRITGPQGEIYRIRAVTPDIVTVRTKPRIGHEYTSTYSGPMAHTILRAAGIRN